MNEVAEYTTTAVVKHFLVVGLLTDVPNVCVYQCQSVQCMNMCS